MHENQFLPLSHRYLTQDIFQVDETNPMVTCAAETCWQQFTNVLDMLYHMAETANVASGCAATRESFQHQLCLSAVARHFACELLF